MLAGINSDAQKIKSQRMNPMKEEHKASFPSHLRQMYTVYITRNVQESYRFYKQWFGMEVVFESSWFILLATPTQPSTLL
ncbi:MAG TPA: hypothetical protein VIQ31_34135, partial [Phormidium sp.]